MHTLLSGKCLSWNPLAIQDFRNIITKPLVKTLHFNNTGQKYQVTFLTVIEMAFPGLHYPAASRTRQYQIWQQKLEID